MTSGHVHEKVFELTLVPSTVATEVKGIMLRLSPVMSWMFIVFHAPVESAAQAIGHWAPEL